MNADVEELLRQGMERFTERVPAPAGLAVQAGRSHRRRRIAVRAALAAPIAAVTAVVVALTASGTAAPHARAAAASVPRPQTDAYLVSHIEKALGGASGKILFVTTYGKPSAYGGHSPHADFWYYRNVTRRIIRWGRWSTADMLTDLPGRSVDLFVNYRARVWFRHTWATASFRYARNVCVGPADDEPDPNSPAWAPFVQSSLACGGMAIAGRERIDGKATIKIIGTAKDVDARYVPQTMFVDPVTYLPVRILIPFGWRDLHWLAPTNANLALLSLTVPRGFRQIPPPR